MGWLVERDEHSRNDLAQTPVHSVGEDGGVESGLGRTLLAVVGRIGINGDIEERVGWRFIVFDDASSSAFSINTEVDLTALS